LSDLQVYLTLAIFLAVIAVIALDALDMTIAAMLGVSLMMLCGILDGKDLQAAGRIGGPVLSLLFGGMVVARVLSTTGIFDRIDNLLLKATGGSGKRYLLLLVGLVAVVCAFLPNATTVILLAPVIISLARALKVDFVGPMIMTALISNSAGLLTLVGDPATYIVGSSIGMTFGQYFRNVSLGGLLSVLAVIPLLPWLLPEVWRARVDIAPPQDAPAIKRPGFAALALAVLGMMVLLFLIGEELPIHVVPPAVAIIAATLALLAVHGAQVEPIDSVLREVDWKTLVFLGAVFCLVQGIIKTDLLQVVSLKMYGWFGTGLITVALVLLVGIAVLSSVLANTPVVAAALVMTKGYLVAAEFVPEQALSVDFTSWPTVTLPVFIGMMFGGTLGGNATLIGAAANVVSAGICASQGSRISFARFMRYGLPVTICQLSVSAVYLLIYAWLAR
jgi:Na+/H+ antiporter NhaD/arsenite permease-like protein